MNWISSELANRGMTQADLAARIGLTEVQMSKVMRGSRRLTSDEADSIRRCFGYKLPEEAAQDALEGAIMRHLGKMGRAQKEALVIFLEKMAADRD